MMSFGDAQCIHISNTTKDLLPATYVTKERGKINVKGKGEMVTFWMESKSGRAPPPKDEVCIILQRKRTNFDKWHFVSEIVLTYCARKFQSVNVNFFEITHYDWKEPEQFLKKIQRSVDSEMSLVSLFRPK